MACGIWHSVLNQFQPGTRLRSRLRYALFLLILCTSLSSLFITPIQAQEKALIWERFDVDITVQPDGTFDVAEHQQIHFTKGSFRFGTRDIPIHNLGQIDSWAVTDASGHSYVQTDQPDTPYTFQVAQGNDHYVIHWYFPPISESSETYTLSYKVHNGLRIYPNGDQVWWKAIYGDRSFPVEAGHVRISTPARAPIDQWSAYVNGNDAHNIATATLDNDKQAVTFELSRALASGEEFEVRAQFPHGIVDAGPSAWQAAADAEAAHQAELLVYRQKWGPVYEFIFCALGLLFTFGGPAALYALWYFRGRDKPVQMVADYLPEAPDDLAPGMVGALVDERVDKQDILATVVDLAQRNVLTVTAEPVSTSARSGTDFIYRRTGAQVALKPYEEAVLAALFPTRDQQTVRLSQVSARFYQQFASIKQSLYQTMIEEGYFPHNPDRVRHRYGCIGGAGLALGIFLGLCLLVIYVDLTVAGLLPGFGIAVTALGVLIMARNMARKTDKGAETAARWRAFKNYLQNIEKYSDVTEQKAIWDRWLPYAIAFGIDQEYIRKFEAVKASAPTWYFPSSSAYDSATSHHQTSTSHSTQAAGEPSTAHGTTGYAVHGQGRPSGG